MPKSPSWWKSLKETFSFLSSSRATPGQRGEQLALKHLKQKGYRLVRKNYANRFGEIDLIMQDQNTIVFVEVRSRTQTSRGLPQETINYSKQKHISQTAQGYLKAHSNGTTRFRFDVVAIVWDKPGEPAQSINHLLNAFEAVE